MLESCVENVILCININTSCLFRKMVLYEIQERKIHLLLCFQKDIGEHKENIRNIEVMEKQMSQLMHICSTRYILAFGSEKSYHLLTEMEIE